MFNVAIIGAEGLNDYNFCQSKCILCMSRKAKSGEPITIFTTGDSFVDAFSTRFGINVQNFYTDWKSYGKNAIKERNNQLLKNCNALIAFDDQTKDTKILYEQAKNNNIPVRFFKK